MWEIVCFEIVEVRNVLMIMGMVSRLDLVGVLLWVSCMYWLRNICVLNSVMLMVIDVSMVRIMVWLWNRCSGMIGLVVCCLMRIILMMFRVDLLSMVEVCYESYVNDVLVNVIYSRSVVMDVESRIVLV